MRYLLIAFLLAAPAFAEGPEFDAAYIKPYDHNSVMRRGGGPGTNDPTHMYARDPIRNLLTVAFNVKSYQLRNASTLTEMFDFALVVPAAATKDDVNRMWLNLLISRFGLQYHVEQSEIQVDEITVGPKGHKLRENDEPEMPGQAEEKLRLIVDKEGRPTLSRPGLMRRGISTPTGEVLQIVARAQPISALAQFLVDYVAHPVVDKTGLGGKYDFILEYSLDNARGSSQHTQQQNPTAATADLPVDLPTALLQQLGLRLVKGKGMINVFVVDEIERTPTEN